MFSRKTMANFSTKYDVDDETGCWVWNASHARGGYGQFVTSGLDGRKWYRAHRFSYEAHNGEIPNGMVVMHSCDNPACVNPQHLSVGTQAENISDMQEKGRGKFNRKHMLNKKQLLYIISSREPDLKLAKMFNVNQGWIWKVRRGKIAWARKVVQGAVKSEIKRNSVASPINTATPSKECSILMNAPCRQNYKSTNNKRKPAD